MPISQKERQMLGLHDHRDTGPPSRFEISPAFPADSDMAVKDVRSCRAQELPHQEPEAGFPWAGQSHGHGAQIGSPTQDSLTASRRTAHHRYLGVLDRGSHQVEEVHAHARGIH